MKKQRSKPSKNCTCGNQRRDNEMCENCSKYKMVFLLRDQKSGFKVTAPDGSMVNPSFWSFLKEDRRPLEKLLSNMLQRAKRMPEYLESRFVDIYHRNGNLIERHRI